MARSCSPATSTSCRAPQFDASVAPPASTLPRSLVLVVLDQRGAQLDERLCALEPELRRVHRGRGLGEELDLLGRVLAGGGPGPQRVGQDSPATEATRQLELLVRQLLGVGEATEPRELEDQLGSPGDPHRPVHSHELAEPGRLGELLERVIEALGGEADATALEPSEGLHEGIFDELRLEALEEPLGLAVPTLGEEHVGQPDDHRGGGASAELLLPPADLLGLHQPSLPEQRDRDSRSASSVLA